MALFSLEHDPFAVAMLSLAAATTVGAILQFVAARAAKKRDREAESDPPAHAMFYDQQRQMIRDLRSQLDDAWERLRRRENYIQELEQRLSERRL